MTLFIYKRVVKKSRRITVLVMSLSGLRSLNKPAIRIYTKNMGDGDHEGTGQDTGQGRGGIGGFGYIL